MQSARAFAMFERVSGAVASLRSRGSVAPRFSRVARTRVNYACKLCAASTRWKRQAITAVRRLKRFIGKSDVSLATPRLRRRGRAARFSRAQPRPPCCLSRRVRLRSRRNRDPHESRTFRPVKVKCACRRLSRVSGYCRDMRS